MRPTSPHNAAGMRTEPPVSVPSAAGAIPAATATADPEDEPPATRCTARSAGFQGAPIGWLVPHVPMRTRPCGSCRAESSRRRAGGARTVRFRSRSGPASSSSRPSFAGLRCGTGPSPRSASRATGRARSPPRAHDRRPRRAGGHRAGRPRRRHAARHPGHRCSRGTPRRWPPTWSRRRRVGAQASSGTGMAGRCTEKRCLQCAVGNKIPYSSI